MRVLFMGISLFGVLALSAIFFEAFDCDVRNDLSPAAQHITVAVVSPAPGDLKEFASQCSTPRLIAQGIAFSHRRRQDRQQVSKCTEYCRFVHS